MNQSVVLKKKGSNPNKAQSPLKNLDVDMQYRSSAELVNTFKIKREHVVNERNNKAKKEHVPIALKRKNSEDFIPQQGKSKLVGHKSVIQSSSREELSTSHMIKGFKPPMHNFKFQTSSKEGVTSSVHVIGITLGNGEEQHDIQDLLNFKQIHKEHDIDHDLPNKKQVKKKSLIPTTSLDQFHKQQGIVIGDERKQVNHTVADVEYMPAPSIHEHYKGLDALEDQEEIGEDECAIDEEVDIDCSTKGISKQKQVRGKTTCKNIHARNLEEREEVTFDKGQAVGPTNKIVSELTNFIGTIARNPRFINLMYTSWHAVPKDISIVVEDMLAKRPDDIPEAQFCQLIEYWKHPTIQRATKERNEEPSQPEMFIATRTKTGKEIQVDTQVAIKEGKLKLNFRIVKILGSGDDAFRGGVWKGATGDLGAMAVGDNKFSERR
ncbi:hypothetical protein H5410_022040 [Solanum commersonii]|uniref:Uncharacterized protein n=1 Tax=Solanum commersonii TaxID=4109 RepID=A0A9J5ZFM2_SOLCO|nr:hypothetical protein H5410_022040 [Solanum commersonii]